MLARSFMTPIGIGIILMIAVTLVSTQDRLTYADHIRPIIKKNCLPCHLADSENPSGLDMDSYQSLRKGGEHGDPIAPGKPEESLLFLKLLDPPPVGKKMPRDRKTLPEEDIRTIRTWIEQGASEK